MRPLTIICLLLLTPLASAAQAVTFAREGVEYQLELPSPRWRAVPRLDVHDHFDFIHGEDRADGYLLVRKNLVAAGAAPKDLYLRDEARTLKSLPGYVACSACEGVKFEGRLSGAVFSYEFTTGGRLMAGRIYYLRVDARAFYTLHFTCARDNLGRLGSQMDSLARSFRVK